MLEQQLNPPAIHGEVEAGEGAKLLKEVKALVKGMNTNTFDLAEKLHVIRQKSFYAPKYESFSAFIKSLDIKVSKGHYLVRIAQTMEDVGIPRAEYEPVGIAKLRAICRLKLVDADGKTKMYEGVPAEDMVKSLVCTSDQYTPLKMWERIEGLLGLMGDDARVWQNVSLTVAQRKKWQEAVELAKLNIGSVGKDEAGNYKDASEGACMEVIAASYILDPNNHPEGEAVLSTVDEGLGTTEQKSE